MKALIKKIDGVFLVLVPANNLSLNEMTYFKYDAGFKKAGEEQSISSCWESLGKVSIDDHPWLEDGKEEEVLFNPLRVVQSSYDLFEKTILGDAEIIDTWLDDKDKDHMKIMEYVMGYRIGFVPIASLPNPEHKGYMTKEHYKIEEIDVVFMAGQPDCLWFRKSDTEALLELAMKSTKNEIKIPDAFTLTDIVDFAKWCIVNGIVTGRVTPSDVDEWFKEKAGE